MDKEQASRSYDNLNLDEKVRAILGAVIESVSKTLAFKFAGVNYDELGESDKAKIDSIFTSVDVEVSGEKEAPNYRLNDQEREKMAKDVDMQSVHRQIANKIMRDRGFDF